MRDLNNEPHARSDVNGACKTHNQLMAKEIVKSEMARAKWRVCSALVAMPDPPRRGSGGMSPAPGLGSAWPPWARLARSGHHAATEADDLPGLVAPSRRRSKCGGPQQCMATSRSFRSSCGRRGVIGGDSSQVISTDGPGGIVLGRQPDRLAHQAHIDGPGIPAHPCDPPDRD